MSHFNAFSTTNSTYGAFYESRKKVKQDQEKSHKQPQSNYSYHSPSYTPLNKSLPTPTPSMIEKVTTSLTGLDNLGNTCYMNTCIQNLIHCTPFISNFLEVSNKLFQNNSKNYSIATAFYELLLLLSESRNDSISPHEFVSKFTEVHNQFYGNLEHDTQEFCRFFLQDLNCELNRISSPSSYKKENQNLHDKKQMFFNYRNDCLSKENSLITDLFIGYFSFEYQCECGYKEYMFSQFLDLPVQMDSSIQGFDLSQMLQNNFYKKSYVDMGENCSFCRRTSKKNEIMKIASLPQILIISLQRINPYNGTKNTASVKFYEGLDLIDLIDVELKDGSSTKYNLFAISNHVGEVNTGHYFSYIKIGNNWYCFEDSKVYKIGYQIQMNTKEVYTLFYTRCNSK